MLKYNVEWQKGKDPPPPTTSSASSPRPGAGSLRLPLVHVPLQGHRAFARNVMNYTNPKVDDLLDKAALTSNRHPEAQLLPPGGPDHRGRCPGSVPGHPDQGLPSAQGHQGLLPAPALVSDGAGVRHVPRLARC